MPRSKAAPKVKGDLLDVLVTYARRWCIMGVPLLAGIAG